MPPPPRGRSQWVALLAGPTLALASFVVAYIVNPLNFSGREPLAAVPAGLLAVVILVISNNLTSHREIERASGFSDRIHEAVRDYLHVTKVGSPAAALGYVSTRLPILEEVRNTSFNLPGETDRADEKLYETDEYANWTEAIAAWTSGGKIWKDVGDGLGVDRLRRIDEAARSRARKGKSGYQFRVLPGTAPQLNFILLSYPDGSSEVLFNWDFRGIGEDPVVLLSRDRDIVHMFAIQFNHLWRAASRDHDSTATRSTSVK